MLFTSLPFVLFFVAVFSLYWFVFNRNLKLQNLRDQKTTAFLAKELPLWA